MKISKLIQELEKKAEFYKNAAYDPHNINTAVYCAILEVKDAVRKSNRKPRKKKQPPMIFR